jgi:hypothetical protein
MDQCDHLHACPPHPNRESPTETPQLCTMLCSFHGSNLSAPGDPCCSRDSRRRRFERAGGNPRRGPWRRPRVTRFWRYSPAAEALASGSAYAARSLRRGVIAGFLHRIKFGGRMAVLAIMLNRSHKARSPEPSDQALRHHRRSAAPCAENLGLEPVGNCKVPLASGARCVIDGGTEKGPGAPAPMLLQRFVRCSLAIQAARRNLHECSCLAHFEAVFPSKLWCFEETRAAW